MGGVGPFGRVHDAGMDLGPLLNAHAYLRVERPPELWEADVDDVPLVRVLGEMIATALRSVTVFLPAAGPRSADRPE